MSAPAMAKRAVLSLWKGPLIRPTDGYGVRVCPEVRDTIIISVAAERNVQPQAVLSRSRRRPIARARQEVMWRLRQIRTPDGAPKHSFPAIALSLGGLDHTTVIFGVRAHERRLAEQ